MEVFHSTWVQAQLTLPCEIRASGGFRVVHCDGLDPEAYSGSDDAGVDQAQAEIGVVLDEFEAAVAVAFDEVDSGEFVDGERAQERGFGGGAETVLDQP